MLRGETVYVLEWEAVGTDDFNADICDWNTISVENVLVAPGAVRDVSEANRPDGVIVSYTLYFPKSFEGDLYAKRVRVRGSDFRVIGRPSRYTNAPVLWDMAVEVEAVDG